MGTPSPGSTMGYGHLNLGPHAYPSRTSPSEPSPQPPESHILMVQKPFLRPGLRSSGHFGGQEGSIDCLSGYPSFSPNNGFDGDTHEPPCTVLHSQPCTLPVGFTLMLLYQLLLCSVTQHLTENTNVCFGSQSQRDFSASGEEGRAEQVPPWWQHVR